jgi:two-component system, NtrC family, sensor kinase
MLIASTVRHFPLSGLERRMNRFPVPFRVLATILISTLVVIIGVLNLRARASWVEPWDGVFWQEDGASLRATEITRQGPGEIAGIRAGDFLVAVEGREIANLGEFYAILDRLGANTAAVYRVKDPISGSERDVALQIRSRAFLTPTDGLRVVLAFVHLAIGLFVILRRGRVPRAFHFYLICLCAFVVYLYHFTTRLDALDWTVYFVSVAAFLVLPALFLHFCMRFPVELTQGSSRAPLLYAPAIAMGVVQVLWMLGRLVDVGLPRDPRSAEILERAQLVYFCASFLIGALLLWRRQAGARDWTTRQQMKWVSYGTLAGMTLFSLIYAIPWLLGVRPTFAMEVSMLFLCFIPLSFAYAVIRYRLLDVEIIVRRGAAYFIASSLLLALYILFVLVLSRTLEWVAPEANFIAICVAALAIALLFAPVRHTIQARLDRFFYKEQFDDRASLLEFARTLNTDISLGRLARSILERVSKTFQIRRAALFLADPYQPGCFRLTDELGLDVSSDHDPISFREEELLERRQPFSVDYSGETDHLHRARPSMACFGLQYMQDLNLHGRRIGLIGLGQLPREGHFSTEDLDLLAALARYAAIALENARLYRSVEVKALELEHLKIYTENIIESINVAVLVLDLGGRITSCNRAFEELYHVRRDQLDRRSVEDLLAPDVIASIAKVTGTQGWELKTSSNIFKLYLENRSGEKLIVNLSIVPILDSTDQTTGCLIVMDDITRKVQLEDQLLQVEKLSSIGLLAAGIAHEVNTPITGISSYTQMLLKETPESDRRKRILEKIEKQTFRAAEIVNGLLNFARMNGSEFKELDINTLIHESLSLLEHQLRKNHISVEPEYDRALPRVYGNGGKLQQVFINLFLNAQDAMPAGGALNVKTGMNDSMVMIDIWDTGVGISQENIKRIYDPFFTTKTTGKGTGLGLAVTYGILQEHGGRIFVDSAPGKGTHFKIKLPIVEASQAAS